MSWNAATRSSSGRSYGMPGPGFQAIRFTLQLMFASSRTTRRASASVSLTSFNKTYSNVSFSHGRSGYVAARFDKIFEMPLLA